MSLQVKDPWKFNTVHPEAETRQKNQTTTKKTTTQNQTPLTVKGQLYFLHYPHQEQSHIQGLEPIPSFTSFKNPF